MSPFVVSGEIKIKSCVYISNFPVSDNRLSPLLTVEAEGGPYIVDMCVQGHRIDIVAI